MTRRREARRRARADGERRTGAPSRATATRSPRRVRPPRVKALAELNAGRHGLPAAQADAGDAALAAALLEGVDQGGEDPGAAGAQGVAQGHRSAVHVDLLLRQARELLHREGHDRESLVDLEEID